MICVGRLTRLQNLETVLRAIPPLSDKGRQLDILGDGPLRNKLESPVGMLDIVAPNDELASNVMGA